MSNLVASWMPPPESQVLSGEPANALAESASTLLISREAWEHLHLHRSTSEVDRSVWEVCLWLPGLIYIVLMGFVTKIALKFPKLNVCHLDMCIHVLLFPKQDFSILMHMPRIASTRKIVFQICRLLTEHPLVSTRFEAWWCSWHPLCGREHPIERTWQWWRTMIELTGIFEYYYYLQLADSLKYIWNDIITCRINDQCSDKGKHTWRRLYGCWDSKGGQYYDYVQQRPNHLLITWLTTQNIIDAPLTLIFRK